MEPEPIVLYLGFLKSRRVKSGLMETSDLAKWAKSKGVNFYSLIPLRMDSLRPEGETVDEEDDDWFYDNWIWFQPESPEVAAAIASGVPQYTWYRNGIQVVTT